MALKNLTNSNDQLDALLRCLNYWSSEAETKIETFEKGGVTIKQAVLSHEHKEYRSASQLGIDIAGLESATMDHTIIKLALNYLIGQKMIIYENMACVHGGRIDGYRILYSGKVFIENGGYTGAFQKENDQKEKIETEKILSREIQDKQLKIDQSIERMQKRMVLLTVLGVVSASILCAIEIIKLLTQDYPYFPSWYHLTH